MTRPDRLVRAWREDGVPQVIVGSRVEAVHGMAYADVRDIVRRMGRQPAPVIWRALGGEP